MPAAAVIRKEQVLFVVAWRLGCFGGNRVNKRRNYHEMRELVLVVHLFCWGSIEVTGMGGRAMKCRETAGTSGFGEGA